MLKPTIFKRGLFFISFDILISFITLLLAYNLRFNFHIDDVFFKNFFIIFSAITILKLFYINLFRLYNVAWRFFSLYEAKKLLYAHFLAYSSFVLIYYLFQDIFNPFPRSVIIIDMVLSIMFIGLLRVSKRFILENSVSNISMKKALVIGANSMTQTFLKNSDNYYVDAILDSDKMVIGSYLSNIKVKDIINIKKIIKHNSIESVIITKDLDNQELNKIYNVLYKIGVDDIKVLSMSNKNIDLKNLSVEDLLARNPKDLDKKQISSFIKDKVVLITGAGGSIGSELSRQCFNYGAKKLILLDNSEFNLYSISEELKDVVSVMQSVVNLNDIDKTFNIYKPQIVLHAAAYKHVPLVEDNIKEGIVNNIIGTKNIIDISIKHRVEKVVLISTDKAVRPTNVMGATKRICELYAQNSNGFGTDIVAVRFGNVLGSSGSVIPKFKAQIEKGENITVTHPDITRYFMLIPEACELVLQAGAIGSGGEIFILDMGEPIKIVDLAKKMIELSGRDDIDIVFTGLRKGEKLYEELLIDESNSSTKYKSITVAKPTNYKIDKLNDDIEELLNIEDTISKLKEIVPEFNHKLNI